jgi:hypothetical protein
MGTDKPDEHNPLVVPNGDHQSVTIALDIKDSSVVCNQAGISVNVLNVRRRFPRRMSCIVMPCLKRLSRIRMLLPTWEQQENSLSYCHLHP